MNELHYIILVNHYLLVEIMTNNNNYEFADILQLLAKFW